MAQGIDWFRWHHGTVTDQKFPLIAKRAGGSVAEVLAVWACVLEAASQNAEQRGALAAAPDFEAMDCALGMADGRAAAIFAAMTDRRLLDEHLQLSAWPRRQPKREREESASSTSRVQAYRARQRESDQPWNTGNGDETPRNASDDTETPRVEKSREEEITPIGVSSSSKTQHLVGAGGASGGDGRERIPDCPHLEVLALFAEKTPSLPRPMAEAWSGNRAKNLRSRWRWVLSAKRSEGKRAGQRYATTAAEALDFFARFFAYVEESDFLSGRDGRWTNCSIDWLVKESNFAKVLQGNYANAETPTQAAAGSASASPPGYADMTAKLDAETAREKATPEQVQAFMGRVKAMRTASAQEAA